MSRKLTLVLAINLLLIMIFDTSVLAQTSSYYSSYIFRIEASECKNEPTVRRQTGFFINEENVTGIVTALHGVADCPEIWAIGTGSEFSDLQIVKVDIERDMALLWSERVEAVSMGGLRIETVLEVTEGDGIYTVGYPVNLDTQLPTRQMTLRGSTQLIKLVPDSLVKPLYDRKSPDLSTQVLSIEGHLLPGHSGAPIFNQDNRLIAVGNGGLDSGRVGISWAVPWLDIDWMPVSSEISDSISSEVVEKLDNLRESSVLFFSFVSSDPSREERIEKTVCKSIINTNYKNINQLKDDLLIAAKRQIVVELFGEFLMANTQSDGSGLSDNQFTTLTAGYVRTTGDPIYKNHETRLGEVCISVEGFVTSEDRKKLEPVEVRSDEVCITENLPYLELKRVAEDEAIIRALVNYDSNLEGQNKDKLLRLMKNIDFSGSGYDAKTGVYCATVKGEVLPIEIIALPPPTPALVTRSFIVKANQGWQDSGIQLYAGDTVEIIYIAGQWRTGVGWAYTDANGSDGEESKMREAAQKEKGDPDYYKILREGAYQSLISKIGDGTPILVGNNTTMVAEVPGILYLRVNDIDESLKDNDGTITVQITLRHH